MTWFPRPGENDTLVDEPYTAGVEDSDGSGDLLANADAVLNM